jgi:hypothetical protein
MTRFCAAFISVDPSPELLRDLAILIAIEDPVFEPYNTRRPLHGEKRPCN